MTGATGYIGSAVAKRLRAAGHEVAALVRPDAEAKRLRDDGVVVVAGVIESLPSLHDQLEVYDVFVHTASAKKNAAEADRAAVETFTSLSRHFVYTSGVWVLGNTSSADEASDVNPLEIVGWRPPHEELVLGAGGAVVRPGCVYGGKQSLLADWFAAAEQNRPLQIVGDGTNRWAMVGLDDLADFYLRAVERRASGVLHAIDDSYATLNDCARAVAPNGTTEHIPLDTARTSMGPFADALAIDQRISSRESRTKLAWSPSTTFTGSVERQWSEWRQTRETT